MLDDMWLRMRKGGDAPPRPLQNYSFVVQPMLALSSSFGGASAGGKDRERLTMKLHVPDPPLPPPPEKVRKSIEPKRDLRA